MKKSRRRFSFTVSSEMEERILNVSRRRGCKPNEFVYHCFLNGFEDENYGAEVPIVAEATELLKEITKTMKAIERRTKGEREAKGGVSGSSNTRKRGHVVSPPPVKGRVGGE
jgi:hypothetical protein